MKRAKDCVWEIGRGMTLLVGLQLPADAGLELESLGLVIEFHSDGVDYPTRVGDRHRLVGLDLILFWKDMKVVAGDDDGPLVTLLRSRRTDTLDVAAEVGIFLIAGDDAAIGGDRHLGLPGLAESDQWRLEFGRVIVGKVARDPGGDRLANAALGIEAYRL